MAAVIQITSPNASPSHFTNATSIVLGGRANNIIYNGITSGSQDDWTLLFTLLDPSGDGMTADSVASLDPTRWTVDGPTNHYVGQSIVFSDYDEIQLLLTESGAATAPDTISYDGDPAEAFTPVGAGILSMVDHPIGDAFQSSAALTYRGEITNSAGTSAFTVSSTVDGIWESESVALLRGTNTLIVFAKDDQDNEVSDTIVITQGYPRGRTRQRSAR